MIIDSIATLRTLYPEPSGRARIKVLPHLEKHSIHFLENSPFVVISTFNRQGEVDASPRGGAPGFVKVLSNSRLVIPDAKGNRRQDSQINIIETGRLGALFFIPGVDETLRINGSASICNDASVLELFRGERNPPLTYIAMDIEEMFLHCAKAMMRSKLWSEASKISRDQFPSMSRMINDQTNTDGPEESQLAMRRRYQDDL